MIPILGEAESERLELQHRVQILEATCRCIPFCMSSKKCAKSCSSVHRFIGFVRFVHQALGFGSRIAVSMFWLNDPPLLWITSTFCSVASTCTHHEVTIDWWGKGSNAVLSTSKLSIWWHIVVLLDLKRQVLYNWFCVLVDTSGSFSSGTACMLRRLIGAWVSFFLFSICRGILSGDVPTDMQLGHQEQPKIFQSVCIQCRLWIGCKTFSAKCLWDERWSIFLQDQVHAWLEACTVPDVS